MMLLLLQVQWERDSRPSLPVSTNKILESDVSICIVKRVGSLCAAPDAGYGRRKERVS